MDHLLTHPHSVTHDASMPSSAAGPSGLPARPEFSVCEHPRRGRRNPGLRDSATSYATLFHACHLESVRMRAATSPPSPISRAETPSRYSNVNVAFPVLRDPRAEKFIAELLPRSVFVGPALMARVL